MNGSKLKYLRKQFRSEWSTSGTTEQIAAIEIRPGSMPFSRSMPRRNMPNSSEEARMLDVRRKVVRNSSAS
jgi:hypothetical protein